VFDGRGPIKIRSGLSDYPDLNNMVSDILAMVKSNVHKEEEEN